MKVVVAILKNSLNQILITQRSAAQEHGGLWEFPGGKVEPGETLEAALAREVKEEVGLIIDKADYLFKIDFDYGHKQVELMIFEVLNYSGHPACCEQQAGMKWVSKSDLVHYFFPEANNRIVEYLVGLQVQA